MPTPTTPDGQPRARQFKDEVFGRFARIGSAFGHAKRVEIIDVLAQGERSVESLAGQIDAAVANTSHHLQTLAAAGLVTRRVEGTSGSTGSPTPESPPPTAPWSPSPRHISPRSPHSPTPSSPTPTAPEPSPWPNSPPCPTTTGSCWSTSDPRASTPTPTSTARSTSPSTRSPPASLTCRPTRPWWPTAAALRHGRSRRSPRPRRRLPRGPARRRPPRDITVDDQAVTK